MGEDDLSKGIGGFHFLIGRNALSDLESKVHLILSLSVLGVVEWKYWEGM